MSLLNKANIPCKALLLLMLFAMFFILPVTACKQPVEPPQPADIASYSLDQVIQIAVELSPECRLKLPGEKGKG